MLGNNEASDVGGCRIDATVVETMHTIPSLIKTNRNLTLILTDSRETRAADMKFTGMNFNAILSD